MDAWQQNLFMFAVCFVLGVVIVVMWWHITNLQDKIAELENSKIVPLRRKPAYSSLAEQRADFARRHPSMADFKPASNFYDQDADES